QWIEQDKKITPLKTLQGYIWAKGYADGELIGHVYSDAVENLKKWHEQGIRLYVYSSGSVAAQKLIFGHTEYGDLTYLFTDYFDTHIGGKREPMSYHEIARKIELPASEILFLSDIVFELDAAAAMGIRTIGLDRQCIGEGFGPHQFVHSFDEIQLSAVP
ncbi:MAG TPA: acireductone synthase, partial [Pseudomonadales bacterium]|nr:acireductone synthase [Pseudomonadales bacterium]